MVVEHKADFSPPLDPGIESAVLALRAAGIETFESCEGGRSHAYPEPTVRFYGDKQTGLEALFGGGPVVRAAGQYTEMVSDV